MTEQRSIVKEAGDYVLNLFKDHLSQEYVYHNYQHSLDTVNRCQTLSKCYPEINEESLKVLLLAAWFHDTGYIATYDGHEEKSKEIALQFLHQINYDKTKTEPILQCIDSTKKNSSPVTLISQIIADANIADIGQKTFFAKAELLRTELCYLGIKIYTEPEWTKAKVDFLRESHFYTKAAKKIYGEQLSANLEKAEKKLEKLTKKENKEKDKKEDEIKLKDPRRGIQTMFRTTYRNHINLSSIADNKANMMIRVNSMIISITLTLVGAKFSFLGTSFKENQLVIIPIIMLLFTGLTAIIFAILSAKPTVTHRIHTIQDIKDASSSILFFGNFSTINLEEFKYGMHELIKTKDNIYDNMIIDLFYLGKVLERKYFLIKISYIVFMIGLILTAFATVFVVLYLKKNSLT